MTLTWLYTAAHGCPDPRDDNWREGDGSFWCVDVAADGTAYTYCARDASAPRAEWLTEEELP